MCVTYMQMFMSVSFIIMALPHTHHRYSNVSLNLYYTENLNNACVQFSVASRLTLYKSSGI